jgi:Rab GDP dissociation inhibitor
MLNTKVDEVLFKDGKVAGIKVGDEEAKAPLVICDPSYVMGITGKVKAVGRVVRAICIMDHPIPNTKDSASCQIIIPQKQLGRRYGNPFILTLFRHLHLHDQFQPRRLRQGSLYRHDLNHR